MRALIQRKILKQVLNFCFNCCKIQIPGCVFLQFSHDVKRNFTLKTQKELYQDSNKNGCHFTEYCHRSREKKIVLKTTMHFSLFSTRSKNKALPRDRSGKNLKKMNKNWPRRRLSELLSGSKMQSYSLDTRKLLGKTITPQENAKQRERN